MVAPRRLIFGYEWVDWGNAVTKSRLEAFSDGVIAILITIMVLELKVPEGSTWQAAMHDRWPVFVSYILSFVFLGIYWNNHHMMLHATRRIDGRVLWANLHLLFWLSLVPVTTAWMGEHHEAADPTAAYGIVLLCSAFAYLILQHAIIRCEGPASSLAAAVGRDRKGKLSAILYILGIAFAVIGHPSWAQVAFAVVALIWLVPDRRIEARIGAQVASDAE
jgi:uncharacterized membrane protein